MQKMKGEKAARRSSFGNIMRRKLSDITNSHPQTKSPSIPENLVPDSASSKEIIDHLVREKMALMKLIQDKNKIIELSGTEIQNLRNCLQKMQLQNWTLAQANSHMLAELNLGKERLKALQHEIVCKEVVLKAKNLQLKEHEDANVRKPELQEPYPKNKESKFNEDARTSNASRRRRSTSRSQSMGSSTVSHPHIEKEAAVSKRRCLRRQSARSRIEHYDDPADNDNLFEIEEAKFVPSFPCSSRTSEAGGELSDSSCVSESGGEARRTSMGRPMRRAAEKVQSYKERPVNIKLRRSE